MVSSGQMMLLCKWIEISGWFQTPALDVSCVICWLWLSSTGQPRPGWTRLIGFLTLLRPGDFWNNKDLVWTYLSSITIRAGCGQICPILFYIKVWTLCFLSLVIFTTGENNDFRKKAKCSYLIFAHSCYDHQSLPGHICPNPVRIGLKGITKKINII